jgi:hypothetical protein
LWKYKVGIRQKVCWGKEEKEQVRRVRIELILREKELEMSVTIAYQTSFFDLTIPVWKLMGKNFARIEAIV